MADDDWLKEHNRKRLEEQRSEEDRKANIKKKIAPMYDLLGFEMDRYFVLTREQLIHWRARINVERPDNWGALLADLLTTAAFYLVERDEWKLAFDDVKGNLRIMADRVKGLEELDRKREAEMAKRMKKGTAFGETAKKMIEAHVNQDQNAFFEAGYALIDALEKEGDADEASAFTRVLAKALVGVTKGHSLGQERPCSACGDIDGCHLWRLVGRGGPK